MAMEVMEARAGQSLFLYRRKMESQIPSLLVGALGMVGAEDTVCVVAPAAQGLVALKGITRKGRADPLVLRGRMEFRGRWSGRGLL